MSTPPTIGRTVHYVLRQGANAGHHRPAIITNVLGENRVALTVFPDPGRDGLGHIYCVNEADESPLADAGTWHWPERETTEATK